MITETDALNTLEFDDYFVILPSTTLWDTKKFLEKSNKSPGEYCPLKFSYNSGTNKEFLSVNELKKLIKEHVEN